LSDTLMSYDMLQTIADNPEINLTEEEVALVDKRCQEIDLTNANAVISFGADIQKKLSELSGGMLGSLNSQDINDIGETLEETIGYLKCIEEEEAKYVLEEVHGGVCGDHMGAKSLVKKIMRTGYFWPTMQQDAVEFMKKCDSCQRYGNVQ